jgi:hypothetical protein
MKFSRFFKAAVISSMAVAVIGAPMAAHATQAPATLTVTPTNVAAGSTNTFQLNYVAGSGGGGKCVVFTLTDFTLSPTDGSSAHVVAPVTGWSVTHTEGGPPGVVEITGTPSIGNGLAATITVDATAPNSQETAVWTVTAFTHIDCTKEIQSAQASTEVNVGPPTLNPTQTTITCDDPTPEVNTPDPCTVTVSDTSGSPKDLDSSVPVDVSVLSGGGTLSNSTCGTPTPGTPATTETCTVDFKSGTTGNKVLLASFPGDADHTSSSGSTGLKVVPHPAAPGRFRPDMWIRMGQHAWKGNNIYNTTGVHQSVRVAGHVGQTFKVQLTAQNDGNQRDHITVSGAGSRTYIKVHYFHGTTNITRAVTHHLYVKTLDPGERTVLRMEIHVLPGVKHNRTRVFPVEGRSGGDETKRDVVKFRMTLPL